MTAAIFAARANLRTAIIEERTCGGLANWTNVVENFPSHVSINGMELMERVLMQTERLGVKVDQAAEIVRLDICGSPKTIETGEYSYAGKAIILATGRQPIRLELRTGCDRIHYCSVCDGPPYAGKDVLVVGGGNSGFDESFYLLSLGVRKIILVESAESCCACEAAQLKLRSRANVEIMTSTTLKEIDNGGEGYRVIVEDNRSKTRRSLCVEGIFVFVGQKPNSDMIRGMVEMDSSQYIITDSDQRTSLPGVFAAGDVTRKKHRYMTTAMSDGTIAALSAAEYISAIGIERP